MNNKPRRPWLAGLLTLLTIGLGHVYAGNLKRGLILFCIAEILSVVLLVLLISIFPDLYIVVFSVWIILNFAFLVFCIVDAISIAKRNKENYELAKYNRWFVYVGCFIVLVLVSSLVSAGIKQSVVAAYKMPSSSMKPTLLVGDHILVNKFIYGVKIPFSGENITPVTSPQRGDIVVFIYSKDRTKDFVKRVIGISGDKVEIKDKKIFINDKEFNDSHGVFTDINILPASVHPRDNYGPVTVPDKAVFVMGDNRDESLDSRFFGFVDLKDVRGKVVAIYWSWDKTGKNIRWDRVGLTVQ